MMSKTEHDITLQGVGSAGQYRLYRGRKSRTAKLTCDQVREIRKMRKAGQYLQEIADQMNTSPETVRRICNGSFYKWCDK